MKNSNFKVLYLCSILIFLVNIIAFGQPQYQSIYTPATSNSFPLNSNTSNKVQWIYRASEISPTPAAGLINKVYFKLSSNGNASTFSNLRVSIGTTIQTVATTTFINGLQVCYLAATHTVPAQTSNDWFEVTLQTPYSWNGTDNLVIELAQNGYTVGRSFHQYNSNGTVRTHGAYANLTGSAATGQVKLGLDMTPASNCPNPIIAGTGIATDTIVCANAPTTLNIAGYTISNSLTYQWEYSTDNITFTALSAPSTNTFLTINPTQTRYYRCKVSCNNTDVYSTTRRIEVIQPLNGVYTINSNQPTSGTNFNSFTDLSNRLNCGISGPVTVNVVAGSGPYTERFVLGNISGTSATNGIRINGNGETLQYAFNVNNMSKLGIIELNGTQHVSIDDLDVEILDGRYAWGVMYKNGAKYDTLTNCNLDVSHAMIIGTIITGGGIDVASPNQGTKTSSIYIANNTINLSDSNYIGGGQCGIDIIGGNLGIDSIYVINNHITNLIQWGIRINNSTKSILDGNDIYKTYHKIGEFNECIYSHSNADIKIINNKIHDFKGFLVDFDGIYFGSGSTNTQSLIANNIIYNLDGIQNACGIRTFGLNIAYILHNSIDIHLTNTQVGYAVGISFEAYSINNSIKNNVINIRGCSGRNVLGIEFRYEPSFLSNNDFQFNTIHLDHAQSRHKYRFVLGSAILSYYRDLTSFRAAYPNLEIGTMDVDPYYTNTNTGNLLPRNNALYQAGENVTNLVPTDINNFTRPITPTIGAYEMPVPVDRDLALVAFTNPIYKCGGTEPIKISVYNNGRLPITNLSINWSIDNVAQPRFVWSGNIPSSGFEELTLGALNLIPNRYYDFSFVVDSINNSVDQVSFNDTLIANRIISSMSGVYTINSSIPASATNYTSFSAIAHDLNTRGVCGPVVVNVDSASGPYNDRMILDYIEGASNINTIRFNGNGATIQYDATDSTDMHIVILSETKHVTIDRLTIKSLDVNTGYGILFTKGAAYSNFTNCYIDLSSINSTYERNGSGIAISGSLFSAIENGYNASYINITNNVIKLGSDTSIGGAYYGITIMGNDQNNYGSDFINITDNEIKNFYYAGVFSHYSRELYVLRNDVHKSSKPGLNQVLGINLSNISGEVSYNKVHDFSSTINNAIMHNAIQVGYINNSNVYPSKMYKVTNNAVYNLGNANTIMGIALYFSDSILIAHNTVDINKGATNTANHYAFYLNTRANYLQVKNNNITISQGNNITNSKYYGMYSSISNLNLSNWDLQNNNVHLLGTLQSNMYRVYLNQLSYPSLNAFQAAYPNFEQAGLEVDPLYLNAVNGNLSPANYNMFMQGEDLTTLIPDDINLVIRPVPPTPGAFDIEPEKWNNAGVSALHSPIGNFCSGYRTVAAQIRNYGLNDIANVTVHWSVNGIPQTPLIYNNIIDGTQTSSNNVANITLGTALIDYAMPTEIKIWTALPNNVIDRNNADDTLTTTVQPSTTLAVNLGVDTSLCEGHIWSLSADITNASYFKYLWDNNDTTAIRSIDGPGTYWVIKTDTRNGCSGLDTIQISYYPSPIINLGVNQSICPGDTAWLDVGAANYANHILWSDNDTSKIKSIVQPGMYSVNVTNIHGCSSGDEIRILSKDTVAHDGINAIYMLNATYNFNLKNARNVGMVVWNYGDGSPEDTGLFTTHTYASEALYTVTVKIFSSCNSGVYQTYSETLDAIGLSSNDVKLRNSMDVYPNPASHELNIKVSDGYRIERVIIYNVLGQNVYDEKIDKKSSILLNVENISSGIYNIQVHTDKGIMQAKMEILK